MRMSYDEIIQSKHIGDGIHGNVYQHGDTAIKLSNNLGEGVVAKALVGHNMRHVMRVYEAYNVELMCSGRRNTYCAIVMELLEKLSDAEKAIIERVPQDLVDREGFSWRKAIKAAKDGQHPETVRVLKSVKRGLSGLAWHGLMHDDLHGGNVMKSKTGTYKIIDLSIMIPKELVHKPSRAPRGPSRWQR